MTFTRFKKGDKIRYVGPTNDILKNSKKYIFDCYNLRDCECFVIIEGRYEDGSLPVWGEYPEYFELVKESQSVNSSDRFPHQTVKSIGITKSLIKGVEGAEELIVYMARVSNPDNQLNTQTGPKLLKYCAKNSHWSIFGMVNIQLEIQTTRDIARQLLRHDSMNFQEYSQRYADPTKDLEFVIRETRLQDSKNRQNSIETDDEILIKRWEEVQHNLIETSKHAYEWAISRGIAKEQARVVLPEGNTLSRLYVNANLRSIIHYCNVRRGNGTQAEHVDLADKIWNEAVKHFPFLLELDKESE